MLKTGILNPQINSLLVAEAHQHAGDRRRSFQFWPMIETVDIALIAGTDCDAGIPGHQPPL